MKKCNVNKFRSISFKLLLGLQNVRPYICLSKIHPPRILCSSYVLGCDVYNMRSLHTTYLILYITYDLYTTHFIYNTLEIYVGLASMSTNKHTEKRTQCICHTFIYMVCTGLNSFPIDQHVCRNVVLHLCTLESTCVASDIPINWKQIIKIAFK